MSPTSTQKPPSIDLRWYEELEEMSSIGIFFTDAEGNCLHVNRYWCEISGMSPEQALGRGWIGAIHAEDIERVSMLWYDSARNNQPFHAEYRFCTHQGKSIWVVSRARAKLGADGKVEGYIGTITDIDKTRKSLDELEQFTGRIRTIIAHMPVILFGFDQKGYLCAWNHEAERVTGYTASNMIGNPEAMHLLCPDPAYRREMLNAFKQQDDDSLHWEWALTARDGTIKIINFSNISKYHPINNWAYWGVGVDITTRKRVENELRERVKELSCLYNLSMLSNLPNLNLEKFLQEAAELLSQSWQYPEITVARIVYEEISYQTETFAVSPWKLSSDLNVRGCKTGCVEIYYSKECPLADEGPFMIEERQLLDEIALQLSRTIGHVLARKDLALLNEISAKAEQLENFSHTVSHELKTPLTAIGGFAEFLSKQLERENLEQTRLCADKIVENTRRMERRLDEILGLAKVGRIVEHSQEVDLRKIIDETLKMMSLTLEKGRIKVNVEPDLPKVMGDPVRLREVIENLLSNAIRYIGEEPNLISIGCCQRGHERVFFVRDNGIGIVSQHLESVFELFTRKVKSIAGDGVGLAVSKRIIEAHGGRIWAESEGEGKGSCFCFTLGEILQNRNSF